ncbi:hormogonium polysaccharide secretion pseudopilin HpsC [Pseudanabaena sp. BC1403]|uniref:hormogonium polysaccharide secretion pseudopilin HpsC n=1 Tax=Pseudanabaena sp. BC1403 TaxID=2043171 RepID=UPI0011AFC4B7|nr:hormogonium polysaccharide secretion pseudopilin HpsC [Pseudanabaena sp. BC1403]
MKKLFHKIMASRQRKSPLRSSKSRYRKGFVSGFTLIELLVAALIASLMVAIMLGFLVGVLDSDRKETVKTNAQEELQAAISYMADDVQEAIYIYGAQGLSATEGINAQLPHTQSGAGNECNLTGTNTCTPILVFWKRFTFNPDATTNYSNPAASPTSEIIGCMPYGDAALLAACRADSIAGSRAYGRDTYTYSLVAYYLKNDDPTIIGNTGSTWSQTARILRWEIKDGYVAYCSNGGTIGVTTGCPAATKVTTRPNSTLIVPPIVPVALSDPNRYFTLPSTGFNRPDFSTQGGLASWRKYANFDFAANPFVTLVDFMDDTAYSATQGGSAVATGTPAAATAAFRIPVGRNDASTPQRNLDCDDPSVGVGTTDSVNNFTQRVPADFANSDGSNPAGLSSFYACVSPNTVTARIFMRGNAIARLTTPATDRTRRPPTATNITFFPTADVRSFGRSQIGLGR